MDVAEHIAIVKQQGDLLATAAQRSSLDAPVPTCPGWTVRDLVQHVSGVHRWATAIVSRTRTENFDPFPELAAKWPPDNALVEWFQEGHAGLVGALENAPPDVDCFTFLPAPSPLAFWARRQAFETGIHRVDAEGASGPITPFEPAAAVDGIEEILFGFASRSRSKLLSAIPRTLHIGATDAGRDWLVRISSARPEV